jgi:hypothetical protein
MTKRNGPVIKKMRGKINPLFPTTFPLKSLILC